MRTGEKSIFLGLFFISGACGLTYEIVWGRLLVFVFGGTTLAITTVLVCFMGGLALGSYLAGRHGDKWGRPERVYGVLEIGIGLFALLIPVLMELSTGIYRVVAGAVGDLPLPLTVTRVLVSAVILLLPTTAMGATLPLLATAFSRHDRNVGGNVAVLYGANTLGAFVGCAAAGFLLLPRLGLSGSTFTVAAFNFLAGAIALFLARRPLADPAPGEPTGKAAGEEAATTPAPATVGGAPFLTGRLLLLLYALSGFAAMAYQVSWSRALILSLGSSTYSFSLIVSCYIFGLAVGSLLMAPWADKLRRPQLAAAFLQGVIALSALLVVPLFGRLPEVVARATRGADATFDGVLLVQVGWVFGLLIVPTLCMGALLPLICRIYEPSAERIGRSVGDVYAANTAGTIVGSAVAGFVLIPWSAMGMEHTIQVASGLNLLVGTVFLLAARPRPTVRYAIAAGAWVAAFLLVGVTEPWSREQMVSAPYLGRDKDSDWEIVYYREGIDTTVAVEKKAGTEHLSLSVNGKPDASNMLGDMPTQMLLGIIPALLHPDPDDVCVIGLGSGMSVGSLLLFDVERVDVAEISDAVVEASRFFDQDSNAPLDNPRVHLHRADGRNLLLLAEEPYDLILSEPSNPWISGIANLFTREFFELAKSRLAPGGVHAQWIQSYTMPPDDFASVLRTLGEVFPHYQVWEMSLNDYLVVASEEPLALDMEELFHHFQDPALQRELAKIYITNPFQLGNHFVTDKAHAQDWLADAEILTDDRNFLEFNAPRYLLTDTEDLIGRQLYALGGEPTFADDPEGVLESIFSNVVDRNHKRGSRLRELADLQREPQRYFAALHDVIEYGRTDLRTLFAVAERVRKLVEAGVPVSDLDARVRRIKPAAWPFGWIDPMPRAELFAREGRKVIENGGDLRTATAYLLRARLRTPEDGEVLYDLARAYAGRGETERARELLDEARRQDVAVDERIPEEPLFAELRQSQPRPGRTAAR